MAKEKSDLVTLFTVESIRPEPLGTIALQTVVLAPAKGNKIFGENTAARVEITRLEPKKAATFEVGEDVQVEINY